MSVLYHGGLSGLLWAVFISCATPLFYLPFTVAAAAEAAIADGAQAGGLLAVVMLPWHAALQLLHAVDHMLGLLLGTAFTLAKALLTGAWLGVFHIAVFPESCVCKRYLAAHAAAMKRRPAGNTAAAKRTRRAPPAADHSAGDAVAIVTLTTRRRKRPDRPDTLPPPSRPASPARVANATTPSQPGSPSPAAATPMTPLHTDQVPATAAAHDSPDVDNVEAEQMTTALQRIASLEEQLLLQSEQLVQRTDALREVQRAHAASKRELQLQTTLANSCRQQAEANGRHFERVQQEAQANLHHYRTKCGEVAQLTLELQQLTAAHQRLQQSLACFQASAAVMPPVYELARKPWPGMQQQQVLLDHIAELEAQLAGQELVSVTDADDSDDDDNDLGAVAASLVSLGWMSAEQAAEVGINTADCCSAGAARCSSKDGEDEGAVRGEAALAGWSCLGDD